ncbi:hypothetical protein AWM68_09785 [Fictibacillus phosphorivorans]|uniref:Uncharacterized protein n=1 Tax=Fictibacillus phosphorivorans TaxID=1221500 RepID=A0A163QCX0_9BACL|nr:hypothetical protein [Fictibacillus phosphorivorans]KZE64928.1 hypothetical protein AWM68_09785 [Fictibacillus phosphorivorans]
MRIPNLIMQSLIAGAVLFIPAEVFAEKEPAAKQNPAAEQNSQQAGQQGKAKEQSSEPATKQQERMAKTQSSEVVRKKADATRPDSKGSEVSSEVRKVKPSAVSKQKTVPDTKNVRSVKKPVPQRHIEKNVPIKQPQIKQAETTNVLHRKLPLTHAEMLKETVTEQREKGVSKNKKVIQQKNAVSKLPQKLPFKPNPKPQDSKAIPATSGQGSSQSSTNTDGGTGATSLANVKANLVLPLIFADNEKVSVYFNRMDLLRSQWVNAPPSKPPEKSSLIFQKDCVM